MAYDLGTWRRATTQKRVRRADSERARKDGSVETSFTLWLLLIGALFILMALTGTTLKRLPLTAAIIYLAVGVVLGTSVLGVLPVDPLADAAVLERVTELAVLISLFTSGLKLRTPLHDERWLLPLRLAFGAMTLTVGMLTLVGVWLLHLPWGAALLLGAILAPTDPVLASDVQVAHPGDRDRLRFSLTGEAGLNDGTAFPFVMLGLGLLGLHSLGAGGWRWLVVDVGWAVLGGLAVGGGLGTLVGRLVLYLRRTHHEAVGLDDFLVLGLITLAYSIAVMLHTYGFLAVFAAAVALRRIEMQQTGAHPADAIAAMARTGAAHESATDPQSAPAYMTETALAFNEQLERMVELGVVVLLGAMLARPYLLGDALWFVPLLLLVIRPVATRLGLLRSRTSLVQRRLIGWFGIRGIGSLYYLFYALRHGLPPDVAHRLTALTLAMVAVSIILHGLSVTPLMHFYGPWQERARAAAARLRPGGRRP
jgi:NhaP-type Na+/H+ or K+/H+ antiporter